MNGRRRILASAVVSGVAFASCGTTVEPTAQARCNPDFEQPFTDVEAYPVFASSEIVVGPNRFLVALNDGRNDAPIAAEEIDMRLAFFDLSVDPPPREFETDTEFIPIDARRGLYQADVTFPSAGCWGAEVGIEGQGIDEQVKAAFDVLEAPSTPEIGAPVPPSDTPTARDVKDLSKISTDRRPDPRYYELSIAQAVRAKEPFVVVFATPKFCQSATCGPMLGQVKDVLADFPRLNAVHVEPYDLAEMPNLVPSRASVQWGLPSEPWTFVVDERGRLVSKYEGVLDAVGLRTDLSGLID